MELIYIFGIVYAAMIGVTIVCIVIENIAVWRLKKLLIPLGVKKIEIGANTALWKKVVLAPFIAWLFPMFIKSMCHTTSYYLHLRSLPKEQRRYDYECELARKTLAGMAEMMINKGKVIDEKGSKISNIEDDDLPF